MQTEYFWIAGAVILLLLDLCALNSVIRSDKSIGTKAGCFRPSLGVMVWDVAQPRGITEGQWLPEQGKR